MIILDASPNRVASAYAFVSRIALMLIFFFSTLCLGYSLYAQAPKNSPMEWGIVPQAHLKMQVCPIDSQASAVVLSDYGEWKFRLSSQGLGYRAIFERHTRIKILSEEGYDWAEGEITYISAKKFEKINGFQGHTLNWNGSTLETFPLEKDNVIETEEDDVLTRLKYTFPKVQVGSIIEFTYTLITSNIIQLKPWYFQADIPTLRSELLINEAKGIDHAVILYHVDENEDGNDTHWIKENIPALKEESYVINLETYRARIQLELIDYSRTYHSPYGSQVVRANLYKDWQDLTFDLAPRFFVMGDQAHNTVDTLKILVDSLVGAVPDTVEKLHLLYNFVRDSMEWNQDYAVKADELESLKYLKSGEGNNVEINTVLKVLMELAGIPCAGMILPTLDHGVPVNFPIRSQFNQFIVVAQIGTEKYFLNATDPMRPYTLPDINDLASAGYLIQRRNGGWMPIPNTYPSSQQALYSINIDSLGRIQGRVYMRLGGYLAVQFRTICKELEDESDLWDNLTSPSLTDTDISAQTIEHPDNPDKPLKISYQLNSGDFSRSAGDFLYLTPLLDFGEDENPFLEPKRMYNIEMGSLQSTKIISNIIVPPTYSVESLPKSIQVVLPDKSMSFIFACEQMGNRIQIISEYKTTQATFAPHTYPALKQLYDHMLAKQSEQIVLKKVE